MALQQSINKREKANGFEEGMMLSFPQDIGTMSRNSHYVQFFINIQQPPKIEFPTKDESGNPQELNEDERAVYAIQQSGALEGNTMTIKRAPTKRLAGSICLYMPNQLELSHKANYGEPEIGFIVSALNAAMTGNVSAKGAVRSIANQAREWAQGAAEAAGISGAKAATAIATGKVIVNRSEVVFEGIDRRTFNFTFKMMPRNASEADTIEKIVTAFRLHSMPSIEESIGGRSMIVPATFDIEYTPDTHLHRISTCVCESVSVKYGGDRTQFFDDDHPVETELSLSFKELEIITKERIAQGF